MEFAKTKNNLEIAPKPGVKKTIKNNLEIAQKSKCKNNKQFGNGLIISKIFFLEFFKTIFPYNTYMNYLHGKDESNEWLVLKIYEAQ